MDLHRASNPVSGQTFLAGLQAPRTRCASDQQKMGDGKLDTYYNPRCAARETTPLWRTPPISPRPVASRRPPFALLALVPLRPNPPRPVPHTTLLLRRCALVGRPARLDGRRPVCALVPDHAHGPSLGCNSNRRAPSSVRPHLTSPLVVTRTRPARSTLNHSQRSLVAATTAILETVTASAIRR